jgi:hypothetical protein
MSGDKAKVQKALNEFLQWKAFQTGGYTYEDAALLAKFWG